MTSYWNSTNKFENVVDFYMHVGFQLRKNASNIKRLTTISIGILSRIKLNHTKDDFYGVTGCLMDY